ncbi:ABC transporter substrate-binding protein [Paenibacillus sp. P96]|uniref:ABC transporter substrate-binding protein n=1 Tax=Paenibacillus zeirhizosphaerae TaxID=2987519 RepID=A0ABT9FNL8_9BACL|nr:ABC transporter substrate-binding protein [Paenibacillus sp. P96]MDP4096294.1 ABC transporter substrate-binding protein [Paenibacillus sp. P96]
MKLHNQFLRLRAHYGESDEISVTMDELAVTFDCTHRNALSIINKMENHGWIRWTPRRGRGNRSRLEFLVRPEEIAVKSMMQAINRRDIRRAMDQIHAYAPSASLQDRLQGWIMSYFGGHSEIRRNRQIDTLRLPVRQKLHTVDPLYMNLLAESFVASHIFDGLVRRDGQTQQVVPGLAHAWEVNADRTIWTFYLHKEVLFHNGKMLTAEDVVYTFERWMQTSQRTLYSFIFRQIRAVRAMNPITVVLELKEPNELFLPFLCTSRAAIVPKDLDQLGEPQFGLKPVGTGPFKLVEMSESISCLEVFPHYFRGRPHLDRVEMIHVPWEPTDHSEDASSPFHVIHNPDSAEMGAWSQIHSDVTVRKFVTCNTKKAGPLRSPEVRARILSCLQGNRNPSTPGAAGQTDSGAPISLQIATIPQYRQDADLIVERLKHAGYTCSVASVPVEDFKGDVRLQSDLILFSLIRDRDEQLRLFDLYLTAAEHVDAHTRVDIEKLLRSIGNEPNEQIREEKLAKLESLLIRENHLHILYERPVQTAYLPSVRGVTFNSQGWVDLRHVWFPPES